VEEEVSVNDDDGERPDNDLDKKEKSPKKKVMKKVVKIVKKKIKKQKLNGDVSKSGSGDKSSVSILHVN